MSRSDLLKRMLLSYQRGDHLAFRAAAQQLIGDERNKRHHLLADDLQRLLDVPAGRRPVHTPTLRPLPKSRQETPLLDVVDARRAFQQLILEPELRNELVEVVREWRASETLHAHGLRPRSRLLFVGRPGTGKSATAEALAFELGVPLAVVRLGSVVSSLLGETSRNLEGIFDFCLHGTWVLLFDEFDALAKERADRSEHGEIKRVVTTFLQMLDNFRGSSVVVAATNHPAMLDDAIWRRFDDVLAFGLPVASAIPALVRLKISEQLLDFDPEAIAPLLRGASHADIELICHAAMRRSILDGNQRVSERDMRSAIRRVKKRWETIQIAGSQA